MNSKDRFYFVAGVIWLMAALLAAVAAGAAGATNGTSSTSGVTIAAGSSLSVIQFAMNAARPGETISFAPGSYSLNGSISVPSGVTVQGASYTNTHIYFTVPAGGYGFSLNGNDSNVTIEGLDIRSNNGAILMNQGGGYSNISILGNSIQVGGQVTSSYYAGIFDSPETTNLTIDYNWFHDGPNGIRQFELFGPIASHVDHNLFSNVWDCGQIESSFVAGDVFSYQYNYGTGIINKGAEFQNQSGSQEIGNVNASYNVFYNWNSPNPNTYGLSVPIEWAPNCIVSHNYLAATLAPGTSYAPANGYQQRFGYAIEAAGLNGVVSNNTIIGPWWVGVSVSTPGVQINNNKFYGPPGPYGGSYYATEPTEETPAPSYNAPLTGPLANIIDANLADAPPPPANTFAGPAFMPGAAAPATLPAAPVTPAAPAAPAGAGAFNITVTPIAADTTDGTATISWSGLPAAAANVKINTISTVSRQSGPTVAPTAVVYPASPAAVTMDQCHTGWQIDFEADAVDANGNVLASSNVVTAQFPGNSSVNPPYAVTPGGSQAQPISTLALPTTMPITLQGTLTIDAQGQPSLTLHN